MPLEGTLNDVSLSSLVQVFCLERKQISLTVKRQRETGIIYFSQGEIIHAAAGFITGAPAFHYLLTWPDGAFLTQTVTQTPHRTINQRWDELLLEGMRLFDEQNRDKPAGETASPVSLTPAESDQEEIVEEKLLEILSRLEQSNRRLEHLHVRRNPMEAIEILTYIVNEMLFTFHQVMAQLPLKQAIRQSMLQVLAPHLAKVPLTPEGRFIASAGLIKEYQNGDSGQKPEIFNHISTRLTDVMAYAYFAILASCFRSAEAKAKWTETYNIFLADLQKMLGEINS